MSVKASDLIHDLLIVGEPDYELVGVLIDNNDGEQAMAKVKSAETGETFRVTVIRVP